MADRLADVVHGALVAEVPAPGTSLGTDALRERVRLVDPLASSEVVGAAVDAVLARATGLGRLDPYLNDERVSEIMVNGSGEVWLERSGRLVRVGLRLGEAETLGVVERVLAPLGLRADRLHPVTDARLPDGSRVNVVLPPVSVDGPCVTIRRFRVVPVPLRSFASPAVARLLEAAVTQRANVVVSGGTGAGKTTLLNALAGEIPPWDRVVTIEDTAELRLPGEHVVRLEARPATEGVGGVGIAALVRTALRMRPDRIVVGEVRGPEALAMLTAMNTGHEGSLSTLHANSPPDALRRLEAMVVGADAGLGLAAVRQHIRAAVDLVVQVARGDGDRRKVVAVDEVRATSDPGEALATTTLVRAGEVVGRPSRWRQADTGNPAW
jgi:pilus assembly protein CpaF